MSGEWDVSKLLILFWNHFTHYMQAELQRTTSMAK